LHQILTVRITLEYSVKTGQIACKYALEDLLVFVAIAGGLTEFSEDTFLG